jgi:D,D-heptose 1,7-bisphosphate phosphatase
LKTIIIAGGRGTRLQHIAGEVPKPLVPVAGKPVLQYQLEMLAEQGFHEVIITINHLGNQIQDFAGDGSRFGLQITYLEEPQPLGTAGGLKELEKSVHDDFLVLYGDVIMYMDLNRLVDFHRLKKAGATLVVHPNDHPYDSDLVDVDKENRVTIFHSKPHEADRYYRNLVNAAVYIFSPQVFGFIQPNEKQDFGKDIFPKMVADIPVYAYNTTEYLKDMGTPDRLGSVETDITSGKVKRKSYFYPQRAIFLDRDGVLNEDTDFIKSPDEMKLFPFTAEAVKTINKSEFASIVVTNQSAVARNLCSEDELRIIHNKMETELGAKRAKLDAIYYCPHHPDKGFVGENPLYKIECECRKPKAGMLLQAASEFNISLPDSYMIGDTDRDKEAGKLAGCATVGVRTGKGCTDFKSDADFMFDDVLQAVNFIVDEPLLPHFNRLNELFRQASAADKPFVILIGGQARSGKSTLSSYLKIKFKKQGQSVLTVKADDWIMPAGDRTGKENVWDRFRLTAFEKDMHAFFNNDTVTVNRYDSKTRELREKSIYQYVNQDIVILEGAPLLHSQSLLNLADVSVFVELDEIERKKRFDSFYGWKGFGKDKTDLLYAERLSEEFKNIQETIQSADIVVK